MIPKLVPLLFTPELVGARVRHRWSGFEGTILRGYKLPDHAIIVWDGTEGRQLAYRLDVCEVISKDSS